MKKVELNQKIIKNTLTSSILIENYAYHDQNRNLISWTGKNKSTEL